jgi:hypothetical protein
MTARPIKPFRCVCEECEPLPPIPGLSAPAEEKSKPAALGAALLSVAIWRRPSSIKHK